MSPLPTLLWVFPSHFCLCSIHRLAVLWMWWQKMEGNFIKKEDPVSSAQKLYSAPSLGHPADALWLLFSHSDMSNSLRPHGLLHARLPCPSPHPGACTNSCPLSQWCIQPSRPLLSPSPPAFNLFQLQGLFKWVSSHQVAKGLEFQLQHQSFQWICRTNFL